MFLSKFSGKKVLLLQGPVGPFFKYLAQDLEKQNAQVFKLNFNGGDDFFYSHGESFTGKMSGLDEFLRNYLHKNSIDSIFVFGEKGEASDRTGRKTETSVSDLLFQ